MITLKRTNSADVDFTTLIKALDLDLKIRDGDEHAFYAQYNKVAAINHVVVAYQNNEAIGCGAIKEYLPTTMEVKRMYVPVTQRGKGIASLILTELESWALQLGYQTCVLETGLKQPEAIALYKKNGYQIIENYGQYAGVENSVCFKKELN
jgi:putative acetyltransferase